MRDLVPLHWRSFPLLPRLTPVISGGQHTNKEGKWGYSVSYKDVKGKKLTGGFVTMDCPSYSKDSIKSVHFPKFKMTKSDKE